MTASEFDALLSLNCLLSQAGSQGQVKNNLSPMVEFLSPIVWTQCLTTKVTVIPLTDVNRASAGHAVTVAVCIPGQSDRLVIDCRQHVHPATWTDRAESPTRVFERSGPVHRQTEQGTAGAGSEQDKLWVGHRRG
ncbi:hypothetical protein BaRGS_00009705 [Batillaria attramentaria]|uniref:Uncharacterized protein n=1 Tax=Batillaria attramentaria TaxID=370345 RepID=A0ABD0LJ75_9CAEN